MAIPSQVNSSHVIALLTSVSQVSRLARVFSLALLTAVLFYYHKTIFSLSGVAGDSEGRTTTVIQWPLAPKPQQQPPTGAFADPIPESKPVPADADAKPPGGTQFPGITQDNHAADGSTTAFNEVIFPFQADLLDYRPPKLPITTLTQYAPHNDRGPGQSAFATYLSTRNNSIHDPYFLAAQQLVYRLLWDPKSRSTAPHPVIVFVAPFIPTEQRDILRAQGAIVRELGLIPWDPPAGADADNIFPFARWKDLFSKLNIWAQTDLARIVFLDLDAFPVANIDALLTPEIAPRRMCVAELLPAEDKPREKEICEYVYAGHNGGQGAVNVGVIVLEPNLAMHARLLRESRDTSKFDNKMAEQAFLNYAFGTEGPFPPTELGRMWNGFYPQDTDQGVIKIVHEKLWMDFDESAKWIKGIFREGWDEILELYESDRFVEMRRADGPVKPLQTAVAAAAGAAAGGLVKGASECYF